MAGNNAYQLDPGPLESSVLTEQLTHRSRDIWDGNVYMILNTRRCDGFTPCPQDFNRNSLKVFALNAHMLGQPQLSGMTTQDMDYHDPWVPPRCNMAYLTPKGLHTSP
ncbi:hypothetical protein KY290_012903 [Solanum tuberosum]|uniref:Uncharacterized protein n=1 Tax=Solanum tuberosum TaxID=4113 RepID=A0ABQ7VK59_SOLTU|nr:hypothetical protein KY285_012659 [Solanum tuberosum]KAH0768922.1 hypothetical protein KY290_012903 [Solanum tuberosum]